MKRIDKVQSELIFQNEYIKLLAVIALRQEGQSLKCRVPPTQHFHNQAWVDFKCPQSCCLNHPPQCTIKGLP